MSLLVRLHLRLLDSTYEITYYVFLFAVTCVSAFQPVFAWSKEPCALPGAQSAEKTQDETEKKKEDDEEKEEKDGDDENDEEELEEEEEEQDDEQKEKKDQCLDEEQKKEKDRRKRKGEQLLGQLKRVRRTGVMGLVVCVLLQAVQWTHR